MAAVTTKKRVLMVDDDSVTRENVRAFLTSTGWSVEVATDGLEALMRVDMQRPDVIVTELVIPKLDGLRLIRALKSRAETRGIVIIVATMRDDPSAMIEATAMGVRVFLTKPYTLEELAARIQRS